jgi:DsbC/DsbD-like thiol-disulfide interchange protein
VQFSIVGADDLKVGDVATLKIEVTPKRGWHVYSSQPSEEGAYQPTVLSWSVESRGFTAEAPLAEDFQPTSQFDDIMGGIVRFYKGNAVFSQEIKVTDPELILVGEFDYQACDDAKCIFFTAELQLEAKAKD